MSDSDDYAVPVGYASNLFDLDGRTAVITGGGSGLGAAIAIGYAQVGVKVALLDVNVEGMKATQSSISTQGGVAEIFECDVTSKSALSRPQRRFSRNFRG